MDLYSSLMVGNISCKGWMFKWEGTRAFNGSKDCTNGEKDECLHGELGLLKYLVLFFFGSLKSSRKLKFFKGSKFSSKIPFSLSPLVYLLLARSTFHLFFLGSHRCLRKSINHHFFLNFWPTSQKFSALLFSFKNIQHLLKLLVILTQCPGGWS